MLYVLHGTDTTKMRAKAHALIDSLHKKRPDAEVFRMEAETFSLATLKELIGSQGLFSTKYIVMLDRVCERADTKAEVFSCVEELAQAEHIFFVIEQVIDAKDLAAFEKYATQVLAFSKAEKKAVPFNTFALGDALGERDKKKLWMLYIKAKENGVSDEEIHGVFWWAMKNIALAEYAEHASQTGLKPFVFTKAKKFSTNFKDGAVQKTLTELAVLFHESRRGEYDLSTALERWILG